MESEAKQKKKYIYIYQIKLKIKKQSYSWWRFWLWYRSWCESQTRTRILTNIHTKRRRTQSIADTTHTFGSRSSAPVTPLRRRCLCVGALFTVKIFETFGATWWCWCWCWWWRWFWIEKNRIVFKAKVVRINKNKPGVGDGVGSGVGSGVVISGVGFGVGSEEKNQIKLF